MAHYTKTYSSPSQLVNLLKGRGLAIDNEARAENYPKHIGYYRFSAYLYPLLQMPKEKQTFKSDATFDKALDMYRNDMTSKLVKLLSDYPNIDINAMGFVANWEQEPLWR